MLDYYSQFHPSVLSIQQFLDFGAQNACERTSFLFLRKELLVRLANIMKEINLLPDQLLSMPSVRLVESWYEQSFQDIIKFEKLSSNDNNVMQDFTSVLDQVRNRHIKVVETMAQGVIEMKESVHHENLNLENQIQYFLDRFYMSRISIRMLINQHTLIFGSNLSNHPRHIGCIDPYCDVLDIAQDAYENARFLCDQYYMNSPDVIFQCKNPYEGIPKVTVTYVPSHLYHMLFEIFKNALRAVVEYHGEDAEQLPKIQVMICKGREDVTIKICDQGGGIARGHIDLLMNYMYSTAPRPPSPQAASATPLAGYGYGLPLSRLYAKYFNGDLNISSVEGYGTDAIIYLKVLPIEASELLPIYNKTSYQKYSSSIPVGDWSDPSQTTGLHGAVHIGHQHGHRYYSTSRMLKMASNSRRHMTTLAAGRHSPIQIQDVISPLISNISPERN